MIVRLASVVGRLNVGLFQTRLVLVRELLGCDVGQLFEFTLVSIFPQGVSELEERIQIKWCIISF